MRIASFAIASIVLAACEPTETVDYLSGVQFALKAIPAACLPSGLSDAVPTSEPAGETIPGTPTEPTPTDGECSDPAPLLTRTQGFWKNHSCVITGNVGGQLLLPQSLGAGIVFETPDAVANYFRTPPKGGNAQIILGHQLLAAKFNAAAFGIGDYVFADVDDDGTLETVDELIRLGDAAFDDGSSWDRNRLGAVLDRLNNAGDEAALSFEPGCNATE